MVEPDSSSQLCSPAAARNSSNNEHIRNQTTDNLSIGFEPEGTGFDGEPDIDLDGEAHCSLEMLKRVEK